MHGRVEPVRPAISPWNDAVSVDQDLEHEFEARLLESSTLAFRVAFGVLRHREDAEDVAQEAFAKAYRSFRQLRDRDRFRAWLVRMTWRLALDSGLELVTSRLAALEISRTLVRAGVDRERVPYVVGQALRGLYLLDVTSTVLARAQAYGIRRLGSLDAIHLATADPFVPELTGLVTYDAELGAASAEIGIAVIAPR